MRAVEITQPGLPDVLKPCDRPMPELKPGEVLVKVHAAGINRPDVLQRIGHYPVPLGVSDLPGLEIAGEIVEGDLAGSGINKGEMVCALVQGGGYAEYCAAPVQQCLPIPKGLSALEAASLPETFLRFGAMYLIELI
jgi:NADPH2:quinone reductase